MIFLIVPLFLFSLNLSTILTHPKSYVRDFYLTEFMKETNSTVLAYKAYNSLYKPKPFLHLKILAKKNSMFENIYKCINVKKEYLNEVDISCIQDGGLSLKTISKLDKKRLINLYTKLPNGKIKEAIKCFIDNDFSTVFKNRDLGYYFILQFPDKRIDQKIKDFSIFEDRYFYLFVKQAVLNNLRKISKSLLNIDYKKFDDKTKWWLFLNAIKQNRVKLAVNILENMKKTSKTDFWLWLLTKEKKYLNALLKRNRIDFYTLWVYEMVNKKFFIKNKIIYNSAKIIEYNESNPWDVLRFFDDLKKQKDLFKFAKKLDNKNEVALKALVLDKAFHYKVNIFITPDIYNDKNTSFKSFVYSIARQESRFIPAVVSRSYALGTMQIMPFLIRSMEGNVFNQFDYNENIRLGVKHLKWLFSKLNNPLMVAYAYNGGIGFVKRKVMPNFTYEGEYEPFLSMELVPYDESREYGKKVITNYIIYSHIFGDKNISLHKLFKR
ncbi:soluble lytic murein transglycosylase [Lebetimonas natsushimae]|uniref:Soluble lytic murein transglycosylase n=1 Tax=Lebetimonas natsushimae TaxID=1936991 RepID=A0A292YGF5_9BACT|nr:lytic transglycosylase domain-containing protein [Lebetimonas natsushimae]GAX88000.1 soluble lytic murein transglycosylase [Lebetimonas natsushimae]